MKEFILLFRADYDAIATVSQEEMGARMKQWVQWTDSIGAQNKLAGGNHLGPDGKVVRNNDVVTDGPFRESKGSVLGYILVKAASYDEAVVMAKACPILAGEGNSVEVRAISVM